MSKEFIQLLQEVKARKGKLPKTSHLRIYFPTKIMNQYKTFARNTIKELTVLTAVLVNANLPKWIAERDALTNKDSYSDDIETTMLWLEQKHKELFDGNGRRKILAQLALHSNEISSFNREQLLKFVRQVVGVDFLTDEEWLPDALSMWETQNYTLLSSLGTEYIKEVNSIISNGVREGASSRELAKQLNKLQLGYSKWRINLLARDQVAKLYGSINKTRQQSYGVRTYYWWTAGDERVRGNPSGHFPKAVPSHYMMANLICSWEDSSVYSTDGENWNTRTGKMPKVPPGYEIMCRCTAGARFDDIL